jgi:hypothetical protein
MKKIGVVGILCLLAAGMWSTGCGSSSSACTLSQASVQICETLKSGDSGDFATACKDGGGTSSSSCPTANALGTCTLTQGSNSLSDTYYSSSTLTAADAQTDCTAEGGTWTAS